MPSPRGFFKNAWYVFDVAFGFLGFLLVAIGVFIDGSHSKSGWLGALAEYVSSVATQQFYLFIVVGFFLIILVLGAERLRQVFSRNPRAEHPVFTNVERVAEPLVRTFTGFFSHAVYYEIARGIDADVDQMQTLFIVVGSVLLYTSIFALINVSPERKTRIHLVIFISIIFALGIIGRAL
jgi:hypothetical protein